MDSLKNLIIKHIEKEKLEHEDLFAYCDSEREVEKILESNPEKLKYHNEIWKKLPREIIPAHFVGISGWSSIVSGLKRLNIYHKNIQIIKLVAELIINDKMINLSFYCGSEENDLRHYYSIQTHELHGGDEAWKYIAEDHDLIFRP